MEGAAPGDTATAEAGGDAADGTPAGSDSGGGGDAGGEGGGEGGGTTCGGQSFTPGTLVLLAGGKAAPISSLKAGDKVMAADTRTGKDQAEAVTAVLAHRDTDLYDLKVRTGHGTEVIHTTASHLFYDPERRQWVKAGKLKTGEHLKTPNGTLATADGGSTPKVHDGWMWDLTVPGNNDHDFYVLPATTTASKQGQAYYVSDAPVLVHNQNCPTDDELQDMADALHETVRLRYGQKTFDKMTVSVGHLDGELVYSVSRNKTTPLMRRLADAYGIRRIAGSVFTGPSQTDAEQIMLNAVDQGEVGSTGRMVTSRIVSIHGVRGDAPMLRGA